MYEGEFNINGFSECVEMCSKRKIISEVLPASREVVREIFKKDGWYFDWKKEFSMPDRWLFYLRTCTEDQRVQGIISATPMIAEKFIYLNLIENAPHNLGAKKKYDRVADCLIAYMCKASFEMGLEGYVVFTAKTALIDHYMKKFGAELVHPREKKMCIRTENAKKLVNLYVKKL